MHHLVQGGSPNHIGLMLSAVFAVLLLVMLASSIWVNRLFRLHAFHAHEECRRGKRSAVLARVAVSVDRATVCESALNRLEWLLACFTCQGVVHRPTDAACTRLSHA